LDDEAATGFFGQGSKARLEKQVVDRRNGAEALA
jgi:hypothetical protein